MVNIKTNTATGFAAATFRNPVTNEIVFVFRGTEFFDNGTINTLKDIDEDLKIAFGEEVNTRTQFDGAFDFWKDTLVAVGSNEYSSFSFTGHSLGGGIAQYMTYVTDKAGKAVTV